MAELVDAKDLKSFGIYSRPGSSPGEATKYFTTQDGSDFLFITKHGADPVDILFTAN